MSRRTTASPAAPPAPTPHAAQPGRRRTSCIVGAVALSVALIALYVLGMIGGLVVAPSVPALYYQPATCRTRRADTPRTWRTVPCEDCGRSCASYLQCFKIYVDVEFRGVKYRDVLLHSDERNMAEYTQCSISSCEHAESQLNYNISYAFYSRYGTPGLQFPCLIDGGDVPAAAAEGNMDNATTARTPTTPAPHYTLLHTSGSPKVILTRTLSPQEAFHLFFWPGLLALVSIIVAMVCCCCCSRGPRRPGGSLPDEEIANEENASNAAAAVSMGKVAGMNPSHFLGIALATTTAGGESMADSRTYSELGGDDDGSYPFDWYRVEPARCSSDHSHKRAASTVGGGSAATAAARYSRMRRYQRSKTEEETLPPHREVKATVGGAGDGGETTVDVESTNCNHPT